MKSVGRLIGHNGAVNSLAVFEDCKHVVTGRAGGKRTERAQFPGHTGRIGGVAVLLGRLARTGS